MNPYTPASSRLFYGREAIVRDLLRDEEASQAVVFVGGRRCGKTRLLERIRGYLQGTAGRGPESPWEYAVPDAVDAAPERSQRPHWPFLINFQGLTFDSLEEALAHIAASMLEGELPVDLPAAPGNGRCSTGELEKWLLAVDAKLAKESLGGIGLLIDEITDLFKKGWHHDLMAFLRRLDDHTLHSRFWLVLSGGYALDGYQHLDGSPPLNTSRRRFLPDLDYPARRRMAMEPFNRADRLPPSDEVLRAVDCSGAGNVWLLTLLLEGLFDGPPILETVQQTEESLLEQENAVFDRWARALGEDGWALYSKIAAQGVLPKSNIQTGRERAIRTLLEYQALVHRTPAGNLEMGPELFRRWATEEGKIRGPFAPRPLPRPGDAYQAPGYYRYDVALSYASPQKALARDLSDELRRQSLEVFYDQELQHDLWGIDLARCLPETYDRQSRLTVLLISEEYGERHWPRIEAAAALAKALREGWGAVLLVSLDGTYLPEIPDSIVYLDLSSGKTLSDVALSLVKRCRALRSLGED